MKSGLPGRLATLSLTFGSAPTPETSREIHAVARALLAAPPAGLTDVVPGYLGLMLEFDADIMSANALQRHVDNLVPEDAQAARTIDIPVRYDGTDLEDAAASLGMSAAELAHRHSADEYMVFAVGFTPGFPFMGLLDEALRLPRRPHPRPAVPAHSVAMADRQTGIYPHGTPGGWHLLGTALEAVYDPHRKRPFLLEPGDRVRFVPVDGPTPAEPQPIRLLPEEPAAPLFVVLEPGLRDLVVDAGRFMAGRYGLARSGPADAPSARVANSLLGNPATAPVLEMSLKGPRMEALSDSVVAFAGWGVVPHVGGVATPPFSTFAVRKGDILTFNPQAGGVRGYLAVGGGFESDSFMGSASTDVSGLVGRPLRAGDVLGTASPRPALAGRSFRPHFDPGSPAPIRLLKGPQYTEDAIGALTGAPFRVARSSRMGVQLEGGAVPGDQIISEGNPLGAVQVTSGGAPIILMHDRGSLGGYGKPATVDPRDLARVAQMREGSTIRFVLVER